MVPIRLLLSHLLLPVKKHPWAFALAAIGYSAGFIGVSVVTPLFYREIIDTVVGAASRAEAAVALMFLVFTVAAVIVLYNVAFRCADYAMVYAQSIALKELRDYAFERLQHHSYQFFVNTFQGSLVAKVQRFVRAFVDLHDNVMFSFLQVTLQLTGIFVVLFILAPAVASFFALWCLLYLVITAYLVQKKRPYDLGKAAANSRVTASISDAITNVLNIKMFASRAREEALHAAVTEAEERARRRAWNFGNLIQLTQGVLGTLLEVAGLYIVITLWLKGAISTGTIVLVQTYFAIIFASMWNLGKAVTNSMQALSDASEMVEIFEIPIGIKDPERPEKCGIQNGHIRFDDVTFTYGENAAVFSDFNLTVRSGEKVGLVGHSGVGKTTITKLLLRFIEPCAGVITIDGQNIARVTQDDLRAKISYVPQDPVLFHRSLRENIAYGNPDATEEEIIDAAKRAHADEFISKFPHGYDTLVGERGVKLSGGERQRVAIARAMLKSAPILLLDEATSSLDSLSEQYVQDAFAKLMEGKTTIVIAHRLSTVQKMDRIVVLENSAIVEDGTHGELLRKRGVYYDFWTHQSGGFLA